MNKNWPPERTAESRVDLGLGVCVKAVKEKPSDCPLLEATTRLTIDAPPHSPGNRRRKLGAQKGAKNPGLFSEPGVIGFIRRFPHFVSPSASVFDIVGPSRGRALCGRVFYARPIFLADQGMMMNPILLVWGQASAGIVTERSPGFHVESFDTPNVLHMDNNVKGEIKNNFMGNSPTEKPYKVQIRSTTMVRDLFNILCEMDNRAFNDEFKYLVEERLKALGFDFSKAQQSQRNRTRLGQAEVSESESVGEVPAKHGATKGKKPPRSASGG